MYDSKKEPRLLSLLVKVAPLISSLFASIQICCSTFSRSLYGYVSRRAKDTPLNFHSLATFHMMWEALVERTTKQRLAV